jgi:hypothetical protein
MSDKGITWLKSNVGTVITVALLGISLVANWQKLGADAAIARATDERLRAHELDNRRHLDPERDSERWGELMRRLESIERKVERER